MDAIYLADINLKLANLPHTPAVVLFQYVPGKTDIHEEPVFNIDTPWPDDAEVIGRTRAPKTTESSSITPSVTSTGTTKARAN